MRGARHLVLIGSAALATTLGACVQVQLAQDKPIEINLNVNIKQEVVVRLEREVQDLINSETDLFGSGGPK